MLSVVGPLAAVAALLASLSKLGMVIVAAMSGRKIEITPDKITLWPK